MNRLPAIVGAYQRIDPFYDPATCSWSYVLSDLASKHCAVIDPVLNFDPASGQVSHEVADAILSLMTDAGLICQWVLETHIHADHLSSGDYIRTQTGAQIGIGSGVQRVSALFEPVFNLGKDHPAVGQCFDRLFESGEKIDLGDLQIEVLATPGHTPGCVAYRVGESIFVGDTLFMPDYGTARADFPGADPAELYDSVNRLLAMPPSTRLYFCHDYPLPERSTPQHSVTVKEQQHNIQLKDRDRAQFVAFRRERDRQLSAPRLLYPAIQVNLRAGQLPNPDDHARRYLKLPITVSA